LHTPKFDQTPAEALVLLKEELEKMRGQKDREQLKDISSDDALEIGYELAIRDYESLTGPNPFEVGLIVAVQDDEKENTDA
jgi:hypothetical protein